MYVGNINGSGRLEADMDRFGLCRRLTRYSSTMRNTLSGKALKMTCGLIDSEC